MHKGTIALRVNSPEKTKNFKSQLLKLLFIILVRTTEDWYNSVYTVNVYYKEITGYELSNILLKILEHNQDKKGSTWPAFLWQIFCQNHFGNPKR